MEQDRVGHGSRILGQSVGDAPFPLWKERILSRRPVDISADGG
ncbi:hypothetical protein DWUX_2207 [Desulfovibrio diazotrophicus]|nr:hypothetical protein DWUX_2207 [Desulfovibrio diazotrophicus]